MASVHRELAEKQSLAFSMTFLPTKLELSAASVDSTFIFEFSSPDARSNFEQAFEEAKKKLGNHTVIFKQESPIIIYLKYRLHITKSERFTLALDFTRKTYRIHATERQIKGKLVDMSLYRHDFITHCKSVHWNISILMGVDSSRMTSLAFTWHKGILNALMSMKMR